jgi:hypothetical protein
MKISILMIQYFYEQVQSSGKPRQEVEEEEQQEDDSDEVTNTPMSSLSFDVFLLLSVINAV